MPIIKDPTGLTYVITTPAGEVVVSADVRAAYNDLWRGWAGLEKQLGYVLPRRLARATYYRARFKDVVKV